MKMESGATPRIKTSGGPRTVALTSSPEKDKISSEKVSQIWEKTLDKEGQVGYYTSLISSIVEHFVSIFCGRKQHLINFRS